MTVHDFKERLRMSQKASDEPFWERVYRKAFPTMVSHMPCPGDHASQRMGIDRVILLGNGRTLAIDEKKREKVRTDICLEYVSNTSTNAPGWIEKDLAINYLAYAFMPIERVFLYDWCMLQRAWRKYRDEWKEKYRIPPVMNKGYETLCVAVPIPELRSAVSRAMIIQL